MRILSNSGKIDQSEEKEKEFLVKYNGFNIFSSLFIIWEKDLYFMEYCIQYCPNFCAFGLKLFTKKRFYT